MVSVVLFVWEIATTVFEGHVTSAFMVDPGEKTYRLFYDGPEDGFGMSTFPRNVGKVVPDYVATENSRYFSS
jgi:hypothetical protein